MRRAFDLRRCQRAIHGQFDRERIVVQTAGQRHLVGREASVADRVAIPATQRGRQRDADDALLEPQQLAIAHGHAESVAGQQVAEVERVSPVPRRFHHDRTVARCHRTFVSRFGPAARQHLCGELVTSDVDIEPEQGCRERYRKGVDHFQRPGAGIHISLLERHVEHQPVDATACMHTAQAGPVAGFRG